MFGKILKINKNNGEYSIVSKGHRNIQGMYFDDKNKIILSTEHGPKGGDEVNINKNIDGLTNLDGLFLHMENITQVWFQSQPAKSTTS